MTHTAHNNEDGTITFECSQKKTLEDIKNLVYDTNKRLFVGNGVPSIMVRLDRMEQTLLSTASMDRMCRVEKTVNAMVTAFSWIGGLIGGSALLSGLGLLFWHLFAVKT